MTKRVRRKAQPPKQQPKKNNLLLWGVIALLVLGLSAVWLTSRGTAAASGYPREISMEEAAAKRDSGAFLLDVRQPEEWNEFHVPGSTLIPLGELASRVDELPRDQEILVVCRSGNRSEEGRNILIQAGFNATSMNGGLNEWRDRGYPIASGP